MVWSLLIKREPAEANPWHSKSAEWQLPTPVPVHDFERIPVFDADPYPYGVEPAPRAGAAAPRRPGRRSGHGSLGLSPLAPHIEPEPPAVAAAGAVGHRAPARAASASFFFLSFLFAYFYLRSLDINNALEGRRGEPVGGLGVAIAALLVLSAVVLRLGASRPTDTLGAGIAALHDGALAIVLQFVEYTTLGFGAASGALRERVHRLDGDLRRVRARVRVLDRDQVASLWRARRKGITRPSARACPPTTSSCCGPGSRRARSSGPSTSRIGVVAFVILYLV